MRIIAGDHKGTRLLSPKDQGVTRPTSDRTRENLFNLLAHNGDLLRSGFGLTGAKLADLCAGTGALGLEALSRGADHCVFVEQHPASHRILRQNMDALGLDASRALAIRGDYRKLKAPHAMDLILIDPPYDHILLTEILDCLSRQGWLHAKSLIVIQSGKQTLLDENAAQEFRLIKRQAYSDAALWFFMPIS